MILLKEQAVEYGLTIHKSNDIKKAKLIKSYDVYNFALQFYKDDIEIFESSFIILLNKASNVIGYVKISQGGIDSTIVDVLIIAHYAVNSLARGVILIHNHPSCNLNASTEDNRITQKIKNGLKFLDINLIDHLIITKTDYYSFADEGML